MDSPHFRSANGQLPKHSEPSFQNGADPVYGQLPQYSETDDAGKQLGTGRTVAIAMAALAFLVAMGAGFYVWWMVIGNEKRRSKRKKRGPVPTVEFPTHGKEPEEGDSISAHSSPNDTRKGNGASEHGVEIVQLETTMSLSMASDEDEQFELPDQLANVFGGPGTRVRSKESFSLGAAVLI